MELLAKTFKATFSASRNSWSVDLKEIQFFVQYLKVKDHKTKGRLGATVYKVEASKVELEWFGCVLILKKWKTLDIEKHPQELYSPDMPRNLAKTVTVK